MFSNRKTIYCKISNQDRLLIYERNITEKNLITFDADIAGKLICADKALLSA